MFVEFEDVGAKATDLRSPTANVLQNLTLIMRNPINSVNRNSKIIII